MSRRIIIVGGGPAGFLTAALFAQLGFDVDVFEGRPSIDQVPEESYPIGINLRGMRALRLLAPPVAAAIAHEGEPVSSWQIFAAQRKVGHVDSDACYGHSRYSITKAIFDYVSAPPQGADTAWRARVRVHFSQRCRAVDLEGCTATFTTYSRSGESSPPNVVSFDGGALIACDGYASGVRAGIFAGAKDVSRVADTTMYGAYEDTIPARPGLPGGLKLRCVPWDMHFRALFVDGPAAARAAAATGKDNGWLRVEGAKSGEGMDPGVHWIFSGTYCAVNSLTRSWTFVLGRRGDPESLAKSPWFLDAPPADADADWLPEQSVRDAMRAQVDSVLPRALVGSLTSKDLFTDAELAKFFRRRAFTGAASSTTPVAWSTARGSPEEGQPRGAVFFIGDAAHSVFPALGEGVSAALEDVEVLARCLLRAAGIAIDPQVAPTSEEDVRLYGEVGAVPPLPLAKAVEALETRGAGVLLGVAEEYDRERRPDAEAVFELARDVLAPTLGRGFRGVSGFTRLIAPALLRRLKLGGAPESALRYGPESRAELLPYRTILQRHRRSTAPVTAVISVMAAPAVMLGKLRATPARFATLPPPQYVA